MSALTELRAHGVTATLDGGKLKLSAGIAPTAEILATVEAKTTEITRELYKELLRGFRELQARVDDESVPIADREKLLPEFLTMLRRMNQEDHHAE
jgi:hypothetical protein